MYSNAIRVPNMTTRAQSSYPSVPLQMMFFLILAVGHALAFSHPKIHFRPSLLIRYSTNNNNQLDFAGTSNTVATISEASRILSDWDRSTNPDSKGPKVDNLEELRQKLPSAVRLLSQAADKERNEDITKGKKDTK
jgi:hypothetical protein